MPIQWRWNQSLLPVHSLPNRNPFQTHPTHYFMPIESFLRVHLCHYLWFHSTPPFIYNHSSHFLYLILCPITLPPCPFSYMHGPHGIFQFWPEQLKIIWNLLMRATLQNSQMVGKAIPRLFLMSDLWRYSLEIACLKACGYQRLNPNEFKAAVEILYFICDHRGKYFKWFKLGFYIYWWSASTCLSFPWSMGIKRVSRCLWIGETRCRGIE